MPELDPADTYNTYELSPAESADFGAAVAGVTADPYASFEDFLDQVRQAGRLLPATVTRVLRDFAGRRLAGALLLRNLPMPAQPPATPLRPFLESGMTPVGSERVLAACVLQVGEPFSYEQWDGGYLVHNKYPIRAHREIQFGSNAVEFLVHTETPFREPSPDFLALGCVRGDPTGVAQTMISPIERIVRGLDEPTRELLRQPAYAFLTDNPACIIDGRGLSEPHPILSQRDGREIVQFVADLVAISPETTRALDTVRDRVQAAVTGVGLTAGDLLFLDNTRVVHGRNAFEPRYDGSDRWLQRMLVSTSLFRPGERPASRLVTDSRYANYPTEYQQVLRAAPAG